ncbi:MAG: Rrf2 family transcriptional regulator [Gammaproteobacteria bacterium]|nr:MAG: Rrf2 family transcriptional regulator [Gammaproteobacteria bacterium]
MRLTTKGRYAVAAMLDVARADNPVALSDIAERQGISLSYLEQLFAKLRRAGLVVSRRGPGGGYMLSQAPESITVADVVAAVNEPMDATACKGKGNCHDGARCISHDLWDALNRQISGFLSSVSLAAVISGDIPQYITVQEQSVVKRKVAS